MHYNHSMDFKIWKECLKSDQPFLLHIFACSHHRIKKKTIDLLTQILALSISSHYIMEKSCIKQGFMHWLYFHFFFWSYLQEEVYKSTIKPISWPLPCVMAENPPSRMWILHVWTENLLDLGIEILNTHTVP